MGFAAGLLVALLGGGGYCADSARGPDPEMVQARALAEQRRPSASRPRRRRRRCGPGTKAREGGAGTDRAQASGGGRGGRAQRKIEDATRRKIEGEIAEQKRRAEEARHKQAEQVEARRKAIEFSRGTSSISAGPSC